MKNSIDKNFAEFKDFEGKHRPFTSHKLYWKSKDGRVTLIKNMATSHLFNTIRFIERGAHPIVKKDSDIYSALCSEYEWRYNRFMLNSIKENSKKELSEGGIFNLNGD